MITRKLSLSAVLLPLILFTLSCKARPVPAVSGLKAEFRQGQVFLTWREPPGEHGGTFNVYLGDSRIRRRNLEKTVRLAERIEAHSARDWWQDSLTYFSRAVTSPAGFLIREGGEPLDPAGGLFVHTVREGEPAQAWYAVTMTVGGVENRDIMRGMNTLEEPLSQKPMPIQPIWLGDPADKPEPGAAAGLPAMFSLHGRGGSEPVTWLVFGDREMGWREGLPFKFQTVMKEKYLRIAPTDRTWVGRTLSESWDARDHFSPAIDTFWYGYNDHIYDRQLMDTGTPVNYTERKNRWILAWAQSYFRPDSQRVVLEGGSMGGCGGLSWGLRHPELFSAVMAAVPLVGYFGADWGGSEKRLTAVCGPLDRNDSEGVILRERMDSRSVLQEAEEKGLDLPFLVISNARRDGSIPWRPNPRYYRALNESRQGFMAAWDNLTHADCMDNADPWFKKWMDPQTLFYFSLGESFPAFSNYSLDSDPGEGDSSQGDLIGYRNFGLEWKDLTDEPSEYALTVFLAAGKPKLPAIVDITPRRVQRFALKPDEEIVLIEQSLEGKELLRKKARADHTGHVTFYKFMLLSKQGNRLVIRKTG